MIILWYLSQHVGYIAIFSQLLIVIFNLIIFIISLRENKNDFFNSNKNILNVKKTGSNETLKFEIHEIGQTNKIIQESKAFAIDMKSMAECTHLTKYFGPLNITKTVENKFIFTPDKNLATSCGCGVSFSPRK